MHDTTTHYHNAPARGMLRSGGTVWRSQAVVFRDRHGLPATPLDRATRSRAGGLLCATFVLIAAAGMATITFGQPPEPEPATSLPAGKPPTDQPPPAEPVVLIEGQVTDAIGGGQAGATVTVRWKSEDGGEGKLIATTTTNQLGDFVVTVPEPIRGNVVVTITQAKFTPIVREFHIGDERAPPYLAETFEGNLVVVGRITDALTRKPIAGASVNLRALYQDWYATTGEAGRFTIKGVYPGGGELVVKADGYGRERHPVAELADSGEILVTIKPERIIHLATVDDLGKPVAAVTIECYDKPRDDFRTMVSDKGGVATLRGIHFDASLLTLRLTHDACVSSTGFDQRIELPADNTESTHKLVLPRAGGITGMVTAARKSEPLAGARLVTGTEESDDSPRAWTDYEGKYTIQGVKPGTATVTVHRSGYAPQLKTVEVKAEETAALDIQLGPAAVLGGLVTDSDGKPVSGVYLHASKWRGHATLGLRAVTDEHGRFVMENAPPDEFEITVFASGTSRVNRSVPSGMDRTIEITLPADRGGAGSINATALKVGDAAPVLTLTSLAGKSLEMTDLKSKTILLDFWATWCGPCVVDMPHLIEVYDKFGKRDDFAMIGISLDGDERALKDFVKQRKLKWPQIFGETAQKAADQYGVRAVPALFIIGPDGKIAAADPRGGHIVKQLEQILKSRTGP